MKSVCKNCNIENDAILKYCSICGYELPKAEIKELKSKTENIKKLDTKKTLNKKTLIGVIVGVVVGLFVTQSIIKPNIENRLVQTADEINKTCPVEIDEGTILKSASVMPNKTLQYNFQLTNITKAEVKLDTVKKYLFPSILQKVKENPDMQDIRDLKITLNYSYVDKNGIFVTKYVIKPEMYE